MKRWLRLSVQLAALVLAALAIHAWQTRDMLPAGQRIMAPSFLLADVAGRPLASASLAGRPVVLYFFAPWCHVCAASAPQLRWFDRWFGDSTQVILVALDYESPAEVSAWTRAHDVGLPVLLGDPELAAAYRIRGYPTYYVLDSRGRIAGRDFGLTTVAGLWWRTLGLSQ
jgi:thiol-disulfide isomerase/thioredoxin